MTLEDNNHQEEITKADMALSDLCRSLYWKAKESIKIETRFVNDLESFRKIHGWKWGKGKVKVEYENNNR